MLIGYDTDMHMDSSTVTAILLMAAIVMLLAISIADRFKSRRALLRRIADDWGKAPVTKSGMPRFPTSLE